MPPNQQQPTQNLPPSSQVSEYYSGPLPPQYQPPVGSSGLAIASLVLGIVGLTTSWFLVGLPLAIIGLVLGIISLVKRKPGSGMAIAGIITGAIGIVIGGLLLVLTTLAYQGFNQQTESTKSRSTASNIVMKAEAYNAVMGSAEQPQYPDYETLVNQTDVPEAVLDQSVKDELSDGNSHSASETTPVVYRGCSDGALVTYWDSPNNRSESLQAGEPNRCQFGQLTYAK